jgi:hypothetical protein
MRHDKIDCPKMHYYPLKQLVILKHTMISMKDHKNLDRNKGFLRKKKYIATQSK